MKPAARSTDTQPWWYYIAYMLTHAVQAQVRWLAEPVAASG